MTSNTERQLPAQYCRARLLVALAQHSLKRHTVTSERKYPGLGSRLSIASPPLESLPKKWTSDFVQLLHEQRSCMEITGDATLGLDYVVHVLDLLFFQSERRSQALRAETVILAV